MSLQIQSKPCFSPGFNLLALGFPCFAATLCPDASKRHLAMVFHEKSDLQRYGTTLPDLAATYLDVS